MNLKELLGKEIAKKINKNCIIGIGTGSTVECAIRELSKKMKKEKLKIEVVSTSLSTTRLCDSLGFKVLSDIVPAKIDFAFDGADAVDNKKRAIKGRGGAMLREKILASSAKEYYLIVDESKYVKNIAQKSFVPIEVHPLAINTVLKTLKENFDIKSLSLRMAEKKYGEIITESGNLILDVYFNKIVDSLEDKINLIPGVIENGIFTRFATNILVACEDGKILKL